MFTEGFFYSIKLYFLMLSQKKEKKSKTSLFCAKLCKFYKYSNSTSFLFYESYTPLRFSFNIICFNSFTYASVKLMSVTWHRFHLSSGNVLFRSEHGKINVLFISGIFLLHYLFFLAIVNFVSVFSIAFVVIIFCLVFLGRGFIVIIVASFLFVKKMLNSYLRLCKRE